MVIYVDLLFLLNLTTDFLLLWMTAFFRRRQVKWWRLLLGSFVGTTYVFILFVETLSSLYSWYGKLGLSVLMMITTFGVRRLGLLVKDTLVFYMVSFLFGGGIFALSFLLQGQESTLNGLLVFEDAYVFPKASLLTLASGYVLMFFLSKFYFQVIEVGKRRTKFNLSFRLSIMGERIEGMALLDSGNGLYEPITRIPVMILQVDRIAAILPPNLLECVKKGSDAFCDFDGFDGIALNWQSRIRIIPYRGVGSGIQMLFALVPDWLEVIDGGSLYRTKKVRVGITVDPLSAENAYTAILHPGLLREEEIVNTNI